MIDTAHAAPLSAQVRHFFSAVLPRAPSAANLAFLRGPGSRHRIHDLDDRILADIGLRREDVMLPETRGEMKSLVTAQR